MNMEIVQAEIENRNEKYLKENYCQKSLETRKSEEGMACVQK